LTAKARRGKVYRWQKIGPTVIAFDPVRPQMRVWNTRALAFSVDSVLQHLACQRPELASRLWL
ncbi:hypothetical protein, partial [uncultured Marinobacter sp.]|uniref:hypothetical protein n=1 Tax=uncultured Marinobacter sp. TaxID=187379 RepID=UPI0025953D00